MGTTGMPLMGAPIIGSSAIIGPDGRILSEPQAESEKLIIAELDLTLVTKTKTFADASGHCEYLFCYTGDVEMLTALSDSRPDMLWLGYDDRQKSVARVSMS